MSASLLWGIFCACSWTWCIGMYLPVITFERYGWTGFWAFAVPNVLGCAGMGFVLTRDAGRRMVAAHRPAMVVFSIVASAFQLFFLTWLFQGGEAWLPWVAAGGAYALGLTLAFGTDRGFLALGVVVYLLSLAAFAWTGLGAAPALAAMPHERYANIGASLGWVAPVLAGGFLLCPYLDLTFHRALDRAPNRRLAFGVFGVTFSVMILFTGFLWFATNGTQDSLFRGLTGIAYAHLSAQIIFTIGAHLREVRETSAVTGARGDDRTTRSSALLLAIPLVGLFPILLSQPPSFLTGLIPAGGLTSAADTYLRFFVFYGLFFPAYVLLFIGPRRTLPLTPRGLLLGTMIVLPLIPLFEFAFLHRHEWLFALPLGLAVGWLATRPRSDVGQ